MSIHFTLIFSLSSLPFLIKELAYIFFPSFDIFVLLLPYLTLSVSICQLSLSLQVEPGCNELSSSSFPSSEQTSSNVHKHEFNTF